MTVAQALEEGSRRLARASVAEARLTAEVLLAHAVGRTRTWLMTWPEAALSAEQEQCFTELLQARESGRPTQYLTHEQEWFGRPFYVNDGVLIPRPETEHVVERVIELGLLPERVLDVGTGSGALAVTLALELPAARVFATDISREALRVARRNARALGAKVEFVQGDLASALAGEFDLIVANPPYVPEGEMAGLQREIREHEPSVALSGGSDGLELYRRLLPQARELLKPGGWLVMEMGYRSEAGIRAELGEGWVQVETGYDLAGLPRVLSVRKPGQC